MYNAIINVHPSLVRTSRLQFTLIRLNLLNCHPAHQHQLSRYTKKKKKNQLNTNRSRAFIQLLTPKYVRGGWRHPLLDNNNLLYRHHRRDFTVKQRALHTHTHTLTRTYYHKLTSYTDRPVGSTSCNRGTP